MNNVIKIEFFTDLRTKNMNEMRFRMEMCEWKREHRKARLEQDHEKLDRLDKSFDLVGMP